MSTRCDCRRKVWTLAAAAIAALLGLQIGLNVRAYMSEVYAASGTSAWSLERAVSWAPYQPDLAYRLGMARMGSGDFEGARRAFAQSLHNGPNAIHTLLAAAQLETDLGNLDIARQFVARAQALLPRYWRIAVAAAAIDAKSGNPKAVVEELRGALGMPGVERGRVLSALAKAYADLGDTAQALSCAEEAATLRRF